MEENKNKEQEKKLSYEELENAAKQISVQADALYKENIQLKQAIQQANLSNMYTELNFKFKVLEHSMMFNNEFIDSIVKEIEDIMTPKKEEEEEPKTEE